MMDNQAFRPSGASMASLLLALLGILCLGGAAAGDGSALEPNLAVNDPDRFAWELFAAVNRPAHGGSGASLWQTWVEQSTLYADPCTKPSWPGPNVDPGSFPAQRPTLVEILKSKVANRGVSADPFNVPTGDCNLQQVKLNRPFYDYVVNHDLWYQEGVIRRASREGIDFPAEAVVFKVDWALISEEEKPLYHWRVVSRKEYEEAFGGGPGSSRGPGGGSTNACLDDLPSGKGDLTLGVVAFHIISKAIDTWIWTTWNHADALGRCDYIGCRDTFGSDPSEFPPHREMGLPYDPGELTPAARRLLAEAGVNKGWHHYRLMGTQNSFTDLTGRPTLLGNAVLEPGFGNSSSCMTCHGMASLSATGERLDFLKSTQPFEGFVGTPDPSWFYPSNASQPATPLVYQTDFLWQLATEAKSRESADCGSSD